MTAQRMISRRAYGLARQARDAVTRSGTYEPADARHLPPDTAAVYRILNFALLAGAVMLSSGAGALEAEATIYDLLTASGLARCQVGVAFTSITISCNLDDSGPVTLLRVVRHRALDYGRLAGVNALREDLATGKITAADAASRLEQVLGARSRDHRLVLASWAGMAAAFTMLLGGRWLAGVIAFASAAVVSMVLTLAARRGIPDFFLSVLGAAVATGVAMAVVALHLPVRAPMIVAGGIMVLVPGYALVASVQDAITGYPVSGSARGLEVLLTAAGIIAGVAAPLYLAESLGVSLHLGPVVINPLSRSFVQVAAAGAASFLYAAAALAPRRSLGYAGLIGAGGWATFLVLRHIGTGILPTTAVAAVLVGLVGAVLARRHRTHTFLFVVPGIMPLVPGLTIYQGMLDLSTGRAAAGGILLHALALGLAIAAGVVLGRMIIFPPRRPPGPLAP